MGFWTCSVQIHCIKHYETEQGALPAILINYLPMATNSLNHSTPLPPNTNPWNPCWQSSQGCPLLLPLGFPAHFNMWKFTGDIFKSRWFPKWADQWVHCNATSKGAEKYLLLTPGLTSNSHLSLYIYALLISYSVQITEWPWARSGTIYCY